MQRMILPLAAAGVLALAGCQGMDADTGGRTIGGAAIGAAGGALLGGGSGAAIGAVAGGASGVVYDQYKKGEEGQGDGQQQ